MQKDASARTLTAKETEFVRGLLLDCEEEPWLARWVRCAKIPRGHAAQRSQQGSPSAGSPVLANAAAAAAPGSPASARADAAASPARGQEGDARMLVLGRYRVFVVKRKKLGGLECARDWSLYDLATVDVPSDDEARLAFRDGGEVIMADKWLGIEVAHALSRALRNVCFSFPPDRVPELRLCLRQPVKYEPIEPAIAGHFFPIYVAYCDLFETSPNDLVRDWVQELYSEGEKHLDLERLPGIQTCDVPPILAALHHNKYWASLSIRHAPAPAPGVPTQDLGLCMAVTMATNKNLRSLTWRSAGLSLSALSNLERALRCNDPCMLTSLDLSYNRLGQGELAALAKALAALKPGVETLALRGVGLQAQSIDAVLEAVGTKVSTLDISENDLGQSGVAALMSWIRHDRNSSLRNLSIAHTGATAPYVNELVGSPSLRNLVSFDASGTSFSTDFDAEGLAKIIAERSTIIGVKLNECRLGAAGVYSVVSAISRARTGQGPVVLEISGNGFGMAGVSAIARVLTSPGAKINTLAIAANAMGPDGLIAVLDAIARNSTVTDLDLGRNVSRGHATVALLKRLSARLADLAISHPSLKSLGISGYPRAQMTFGPDISSFLSCASDGRYRLRKLDISGNMIGDAELAKFFSTLSLNTVLTELNIGENQIGMNTLQALSTCLLYNRTITRVPLPGVDVHEIMKATRSKKLRATATGMLQRIGERLQENCTKKLSPSVEQTAIIVRSLSQKNLTSMASDAPSSAITPPPISPIARRANLPPPPDFPSISPRGDKELPVPPSSPRPRLGSEAPLPVMPSSPRPRLLSELPLPVSLSPRPRVGQESAPPAPSGSPRPRLDLDAPATLVPPSLPKTAAPPPPTMFSMDTPVRSPPIVVRVAPIAVENTMTNLSPAAPGVSAIPVAAVSPAAQATQTVVTATPVVLSTQSAAAVTPIQIAAKIVPASPVVSQIPVVSATPVVSAIPIVSAAPVVQANQVISTRPIVSAIPISATPVVSVIPMTSVAPAPPAPTTTSHIVMATQTVVSAVQIPMEAPPSPRLGPADEDDEPPPPPPMYQQDVLRDRGIPAVRERKLVRKSIMRTSVIKWDSSSMIKWDTSVPVVPLIPTAAPPSPKSMIDSQPPPRVVALGQDTNPAMFP